MTWQFCVVLCVACLICGLLLGTLLHYCYGEPKCKHHWTEIARKDRGKKCIVVHLCENCGRRKFTRY